MAEGIVEHWTVAGMSCGGCAASIQRALAGQPGVHSVQADAARNSVTLQLESTGVDREALAACIEAAGFEVVER